MKKKLPLTFLAIVLAFNAFSQQWLYLPSGSTDNGITAGDISVTGDSITVEALITFQNTSPAADAYDIVSKHSNIFDCSYLFRPTDFAIQTASGFVSLVNPIPLCENNVYHLAGTYDGDSVKYFVNGTQVASQHWTGSLFQNTLITGIGNITFSLDFNEQFTGYLDEVRIWKVARTSQELYDNMFDLPNPTSQNDLLAYYKFEGSYTNAQGNSLYDGVAYGAELSNVQSSFFTGIVSGVFCHPTAINNDFNSPLKIYPNPTTSIVNIELKTESNRADISLYNLLGENLFHQSISSNNNSGKNQFDLSEYPNGTYFISVKTEKENIIQKIIKQ